MNIILFSTGCPKCNILEKKLAEKDVKYTINSDVDEMQAKGFNSLPVLQVGEEALDFSAAIRWINEIGGNA